MRALGGLTIDGAHGEGGGQILRSAASLAALSGRSVRIERIRAGRPTPGLAAQHLTALRAAARLCDGELCGDVLGSQAIELRTRTPVRAGEYRIDVADAREGGSAGSALLVLQTMLLPLAFASGPSRIELHGGTHLRASPSYDYVEQVWLPALRAMGVDADVRVVRSGWYPVGRGEVRASVGGAGASARLGPFIMRERGPLLRVTGIARAANLPAHIPQRMAARACALLEREGVAAEVTEQRDEAACPGAALLLTARYEHGGGGYSALGARGKPAEVLAEEAVSALLAHRASGAALEQYLSDQMILPAALAAGESAWSVARVTRHLLTNAWVVERFGLARVRVEPAVEGERGMITVTPAFAQASA
jgi:RNA 3'-terminal phosphate cyclase (ATP)